MSSLAQIETVVKQFRYPQLERVAAYIRERMNRCSPGDGLVPRAPKRNSFVANRCSLDETEPVSRVQGV